MNNLLLLTYALTIIKDFIYDSDKAFAINGINYFWFLKSLEVLDKD